MNMSVISSFLNSYKTWVISFAAVLVTFFGVSYIKDSVHKRALSVKDSQIQSLTTQVTFLKGQKDLQEQKTAEALANYASEKQKAIAAQKRVDQLINSPGLPAVTAYTNLADCNKELEILRTRCTENQEILVAEIKQDRETIAAADKVISSQKEELATADKIIQKDGEIITSLTSKCTLLEDEVKIETERKKLWRTTSLTEAVIIVGLILAL